MNANVATSPDGENTVITLTLPRRDLATLMDRWTWDELKIVLSSGREKYDVTFPKLQEQKNGRRI